MKIVEMEVAADVEEQETSVEQNQLIDVVSCSQRGRIEAQRCYMGPRTPQQACGHNSEAEFFQSLVNRQGQRFDDPRTTYSPGMEAYANRNQKDENFLKTNFDQICSLVTRAQSFRKSSVSKLSPDPGSPGTTRRASQPLEDLPTSNNVPPRSASYSPLSDTNRTESESFHFDQDQLLYLVDQAQRGRMEEQRCSINPFAPSFRHVENNWTDPETEQLLKCIANTQTRRFEDQRANVNVFPKTPAPSDVLAPDSDQFYSMVSKLQGSRIDDQRCSAPHIQLGTPAPPRKSQSQTLNPSESECPEKSTRRSASFSPATEEQMIVDQDRLFAMVHQAQQRRMDDQRCSLDFIKKTSSFPNTPNNNPTEAEKEELFKLVASLQNRRLDDQRMTLGELSAFHPAMAGLQKEKNKAAPQIILTPASPAAPKKACSRPASPTRTPCDPELRCPPRSASFSPVSERERSLYDDMQITFQISMCFPPLQPQGAENAPCQFPEVFLTVGQQGESVVLPLSPRLGRPVCLNVNPPRKHRSRSSSPRRSPARQPRSRPSSPRPGDTSGPIGPHEDYFSLIQRVHSAQLQANSGRDREEANKEAKKGKGKSSGKKDKKDGSKEKRK